MENLYCKKCGIKLMPNSKFCYKCGEKVNMIDECVDDCDKLSKVTQSVGKPNIVYNRNINQSTGKAELIGFLIISAFIGLIGGYLTALAVNSFWVGFMGLGGIVFLILLISFLSVQKKDKLVESFGIRKEWELSHDYSLLLDKMKNELKFTEKECELYIVRELLKEINIKETFKENEYDVDKTTNAIFTVMPIEINLIKLQVLKADEAHKKELKEAQELIEKKAKEAQQKTYTNYSENPKKTVSNQSPKKQYKMNKKAGIVSCPKCGSTSITTTNKKISFKKGVAGAAVGSLVNPVGTVVGAAVGATHSKKIYNVCMNCGHRWKP